MAAESTPAKIRRLFSSFLSDKTNSNHFDDDGTLPKEAEENLKESQERRDKELFFKRVETYSALTWFAKPPDVSPLVCASYGWENTDTDMLRCVNCRAFVCGTLPKQVDAESYKKCCEELKRKLKEAHEIVCKWSSNPTPEKLYSLPFYSKEVMLKEFQQRLSTLETLKLPQLSYRSIDDQGVTEDRLSEYIGRIPGTTDHDHALLALCGWLYCGSKLDILQCSYCRRKVGLWNYSHSEPDKKTAEHELVIPKSPQECDAESKQVDTDGEHSSEGSINGDMLKHTSNGGKRSASGDNGHCESIEQIPSPEPPSKRPKLDKQSFDPLAEHRYWCLIIHSEAFHEPGTFAKVSLATTPNPIARQPDSRCSSVSLPTSPTTQSEFTNPDMDRDHTWLKVMKVLSDTNKSEEFQAQMKSSPPMACVQRLRHVLRKCTSPDKLSTVNSKIAS
ncbi:zinc finger C3HC-type protein 1-like [Mya arenaria]|uniref:zinc finger C3HC-type protein 1-like n=1 Tax=Mya arenaria TaxID=6604 RepID=UPI0022E2ED04|nr:zinc finger C3HC-type protein 1-like [Mya arenaria]